MGLYTPLEILKIHEIKQAFKERAGKYTQALDKVLNQIYHPAMSIVSGLPKECPEYQSTNTITCKLKEIESIRQSIKAMLSQINS